MFRLSYLSGSQLHGFISRTLFPLLEIRKKCDLWMNSNKYIQELSMSQTIWKLRKIDLRNPFFNILNENEEKTY